MRCLISTKVAGCNHCHTRNYGQSGGTVAEESWLTGGGTGYSGPWGTTYATNLRLYMQGFSEEQWLMKARSLRARLPMPWFALRDMSDDDLRALYRYVRQLGAAGMPAPAFVAPRIAPDTPYFSMTPQLPTAYGTDVGE